MSQSTIAHPTVTATTPTLRRISPLVIAVIILAAMLALAVVVFAWTLASDSEPSTPTLPSVEADQTPVAPSSDADRLPADGVPVLENCVPRQACAF